MPDRFWVWLRDWWCRRYPRAGEWLDADDVWGDDEEASAS